MIATLARYWQFVVIGSLAGAVAVQTLRLHDEQADHVETVAKWSNERAAHDRVALQYREKIAAIGQQHAVEQQLLEESYAKRIKSLEDQRRADIAATVRLRDIIAAYAAPGRSGGAETDAAAIQRAADRLNTLAGLLQEGVELVVEGRGIVERRDAEVARLIDQITIDRKACSRE